MLLLHCIKNSVKNVKTFFIRNSVLKSRRALLIFLRFERLRDSAYFLPTIGKKLSSGNLFIRKKVMHS